MGSSDALIRLVPSPFRGCAPIHLNLRTARRRARWGPAIACALSLLGTLTALAQTGTVTLGWNRSPDSSVAGYNIYSGGASQSYTNMVSLGNVTNFTVSGLVSGSTYFFSVTAVDALGLESPFSNETTYQVPQISNPNSTNTPPGLSAVADQTIGVNSTTGPIPFWVTDLETPASSLSVAATASNPTLVPDSSLSLTNNGANWTVVITPATGQTGTAVISLTVCDTSLCTTTNFLLTVLAPPTVVLASPGAGASYLAPANLTLSANVTANGHVVSKVRFLNGSTVVGEATAAPYAISWNNVNAGTYPLAVQAVYDAGAIVASSVTSVTVSAAPGLPAPWQTSDIGAPGVTGSATISNGVFTLVGSGNISGSADNFRFLYQPLTGDGEIQAQIVSASNVGSSDLCGAMIRESLTAGSRYALMGYSPGSAMRWQRRNNTSSGTSSTKAGSAALPNAWVRIVRTGNSFCGYKSSDGAKWTLISSNSISMAPNIYIGLALASGSTTKPTSCVLSNILVVP